VYEVELKVRADHDAVRARLPEDVDDLGVVEQVDTYFDAPHRAFAETDEALRLRRERRVEDDREAAASEAAGAAGGPTAGEEGAPAAGRGDGPSAGGDVPGTADEYRGDSWVTELTYKGPLLERESKSREELETVVADGRTLRGILERLGFTGAAEVRKERERYRVGEFTVTLDAVEGLGTFLEVETEQEEADIEAARERGQALLADLGCDPDEQLRTSYLGLLLEEGAAGSGTDQSE